jgi:hypothetical protein
VAGTLADIMSRNQHGTPRASHDALQPSSRTGGDGAHAPAAHAFLVRLWKETRERSGERPVWRGTLSDLQGHSVGSFGSIVELGELLALATGAGELLLRDRDHPARE